MQKQKPLVFIHIPKTAGSSLVCDLEHVLGQSLNIVNGLDNADIQVRKQDHRFITGHIWLQEWINRFGENYNFATFLRDPIRRMISEYYYVISPKHSDPETAKNLYPTLQSFIEDPENHNRQFRQLITSENETIDDVLARLDSFYFVGTVENYKADRNELLAKLGTPWPDLPRVNVGSYDYDNVSKDLIKLARSVNAADVALYSAVKKRVNSRKRRSAAPVALPI